MLNRTPGLEQGPIYDTPFYAGLADWLREDVLLVMSVNGCSVEEALADLQVEYAEDHIDAARLLAEFGYTHHELQQDHDNSHALHSERFDFRES